MINVIDAIMGSGKTSAAISYMRNHPDQKFIYVTPFIDEAKRITEACPELNFVEPEADADHEHSKVKHTAELIEQGRNVATTHQALKRYTADITDGVKKGDYTLILDECIDVLDKMCIDRDEIELFEEAGYIEESPANHFHLVKDGYKGKAFSELFDILKDRDVVRLNGRGEKPCYYWEISPRLLTSFRDVFILTYMFPSSNLRYFFDLYDISYRQMYITRSGDDYGFSETDKYIPEYVYTIWDKIHILDNERMNAIGNKATALSESWFTKKDSDTKQLKNNLYNYFQHVKHCTVNERLWGCYAGTHDCIERAGFKKSFLVFNSRATNKYASAKVLAYCANVYYNVGRKLYYEQCGIEVDEDAYALSTLVQWIWRSAIRNGEEIDVYIPSKRMRDLFINWLDSLEDLNPDKEEVAARIEARELEKKHRLSPQQIRWKKYHEEFGDPPISRLKQLQRKGGKKSKLFVPDNDPDGYTKYINGGLQSYDFI